METTIIIIFHGRVNKETRINFCRQMVLALGNDENRILEKRSASAAEIKYFRKIHVAANI